MVSQRILEYNTKKQKKKTMEQIQKAISLELAKDRLICSGISHISETQYAYDRIIDSGDSIVSKYRYLIPLIKQKDGRYLLRYKNMISKYYWLKNKFISSCSIYYVCNRGGKKKLIQKENNNPFLDSSITNDNIIKYREDFEISGFSIGYSICFTSEYDNLIKKYKEYTLAKDYYNFISERVIKNGLYNTIGSDSGIPYVNVNFYLEEEYDDEGVLTPYIIEWEAGKKVCVGDYVYFNDGQTKRDTKPYRLVSGNTIFENFKEDELGNYEISKQIYDEYVKAGKTKTSVTESFVYSSLTEQLIPKYFIYTPHYEGEYDSVKKITYFDSIYETNKHFVEGYTKIDESSLKTKINSISMSLLGEVYGMKYDVDDNGDVLPFKLSGDTPVFLYSCSINNISTSYDGRVVGNAVTRITFFKTTNKKIKKTYNLTDNYNEQITINNIIKDCDAVEIEYYVLSKVEAVNNTETKYKIDTNTGIKYNEKYFISIENEEFTIEGTEKEYRYIRIGASFIDTNSYMNDDLENKQWNPTFANLNFKQSDVIFETIPYFKEESLFGAINQRKDVSVDIDRGENAAFEKHNALTEVNSMEDLIHYRNNYWNVSSES